MERPLPGKIVQGEITSDRKFARHYATPPQKIQFVRTSDGPLMFKKKSDKLTNWQLTPSSDSYFAQSPESMFPNIGNHR
jgi:hypothetical protein